MGRRKVNSKVVRVTMPTDAIEDFERLAKKLHMDLGMTIRFCASLQLAQFQTTIVKPDLAETDDQRQQRATTVVEGYLPDVLERSSQPGVESQPQHREFGFIKPKGELDGAVWVPTLGYMAGL